MTEFLRRGAFMILAALPLLAGCASDGCEYLVYEETPEAAPPLVLPEGVPAPPESGAFRVPPGDAAPVSDRCIAQPPMTLPPEVLIDPEEAEEEAAPEAPDNASGAPAIGVDEPPAGG